MKTKFIADKCYYEKFPVLPVTEKHKLFNAAYFVFKLYLSGKRIYL